MESNTTYFYNALNSTLRNIRIAKEFHHTKGHYEVRLRCTIAICVVNFLLCFTALFGNSAIILTIWKKSSLHCAANILLTSLAVSDFAVGLISHPLFIANLLMRIRYFSFPPRFLWVSFNVLTTFLTSVSFLTVTANWNGSPVSSSATFKIQNCCDTFSRSLCDHFHLGV